MKIDGKIIASHIFDELKKKVKDLKKKNIVPHLVVILVGNDPASVAYVSQKEIKTIEVGAKITIKNLASKIPASQRGEQNSELLKTIQDLNRDKTVHGIIVQLPLPKHLDENIALRVNPEKDIDAFNSKSPYPMPLAKAVLKILENVYKIKQEQSARGANEIFAARLFEPQRVSQQKNFVSDLSASLKSSFINWMEKQSIVVIGKGKTGGAPTIDMLKKLGLKPGIVDSQTPNPRVLTTKADILISAVGKLNIVTLDMLKKGVILISVGMHKGENGKLHGDYNEEEIKDIASFYTPVPGGIGPVNVACLIENLILSAEKQKK